MRSPAITLNNQTLAEAAQQLARRDRHLSAILQTHGHPPLWRRPATFTTLVRIILEQQVSLKSADAMFRKLKRSILPFKPERVLQLGPNHLRTLGVTRQKTAYLINISTVIVDGTLDLRQLWRLSDAEVKHALIQIKGLGSWSADVYLLMAMCRADIWPAGDLALAVAVQELNQLKRRPTFAELEEFAEKWRPYRAVAARMLWQYYLGRTTNGAR
jgi:DNA-3-methyladenine glycosylase II